MLSVKFEDLSEKDVLQLWEKGARTPGWPIEFSSLGNFQQYVFTNNFVLVFKNGFIKGIWVNDLLAGFTSLHEVGQEFFEDGISVFEGGTFLLQSFRGFGLNETIKRYLLTSAFRIYNSTWCLFCIPVENKQAIRAIEKINIPFERISNLDKHHPLYRYLKWKIWKIGKEFIFYGIELSSSIEMLK